MASRSSYLLRALVLQLLISASCISPIEAEHLVASVRSHANSFRCQLLASSNFHPPEAAKRAYDASPPAKPTMAQNALAGAIAGFVARIAVAPIDLIKIRLQIQTNPISQASKFKYKGLFGTMKTIVKEEGVFALWKGNVPAQVMVMSFLAIKFSTYNAARDLIRSVDKVQWTNTHEGQLSMNFVAGGIAGASATIGTYPLDLLRTRIASRTDVVRSSVVAQEISALWRASGLFAFYQGLVPSLISIVPYMAIQLSTFEAGKAAYMRLLHMDNVDGDLDMSSKKLGLLPSTIIGAAAGGFSKFATLPLDLCKKRMQMNMASGKGVFQTMSIIAREEGVKALWKGGLPAVFKTIPATAITFAVYEACKHIPLTHARQQT